MSLLSFMDEMLGEELKEIGFTRKKGLEWYKIIDDCIYLNVYVRRIGGGFIHIYCKSRSLFSPLIGPVSFMDFVNMIYSEVEKQNGRSGSALHYDERPEVKEKMMDCGRKIFGSVKPILGSVSDLKSCFEANEILNSLRCTGKAAITKDHTSWPPEDGYFILCRLGLYEEAGNYMNNAIINYRRYLERTSSFTALDAELADRVKKELTPYIRLVETKDYAAINSMMKSNYIAACDELEQKYRIKINKDRIVDELDHQADECLA